MKYDMCGIQISLLLLLLATCGHEAYAAAGNNPTWVTEYTQPPAPSPSPKKTTPPPPSPLQSPRDTPTDLAPIYKSPWPDFNYNYQVAVRLIQQTDDLQHKWIWGWFSNHPILQFMAIILLSGAILAIGRLWLRQCTS